MPISKALAKKVENLTFKYDLPALRYSNGSEKIAGMLYGAFLLYKLANEIFSSYGDRFVVFSNLRGAFPVNHYLRYFGSRFGRAWRTLPELYKYPSKLRAQDLLAYAVLQNALDEIGYAKALLFFDVGFDMFSASIGAGAGDNVPFYIYLLSPGTVNRKLLEKFERKEAEVFFNVRAPEFLWAKPLYEQGMKKMKEPRFIAFGRYIITSFLYSRNPLNERYIHANKSEIEDMIGTDTTKLLETLGYYFRISKNHSVEIVFPSRDDSLMVCIDPKTVFFYESLPISGSYVLQNLFDDRWDLQPPHYIVYENAFKSLLEKAGKNVKYELRMLKILEEHRERWHGRILPFLEESFELASETYAPLLE